jgi:hypothetical protein
MAVGKENNIQGSRRDIQDSQFSAAYVERQADVQKDNRNERHGETRPPVTWSPRRGKREQSSGGSTSATQVQRNINETDNVNRDFERLLVGHMSSLDREIGLQ